MTGLVRGARGGLLALAMVGLTTWGVRAKPPRPPRPGGPAERDRPAGHLRRAYETIGVVSLWMRSDRIKLPRQTAGLLDQAKTFYRRAERAYRDGERRQAEELALAANDAARGLLHRIRAGAPAVAGLPAPPAAEGPEPDDILRRARERLTDAENAPKGPARAFLDAGRRAYDQARMVWRDDPARAAELARAAEAWSHVGEHLMRADDERVDAPRAGRHGPAEPPDDRPRRPRPPRERDDEAPPPPPR